MKYHQAAIYFNRENIFDGYTGSLLFKGQLRNFNDASSTGATLRRRSLSVAPGTALPRRGCLKVGSLRWVASLGITDTFQGVDARQTYNLRVGSSLFEILTPAQACSSLASATSAYGYEEFFKNLQDSNSTSDYETFWSLFFYPVEPVREGSFLRCGSRLLRVRQAYVNAENLRVAEADELDADWSQSVSFTNTGAYDPITDTYAPTTGLVQAVKIDVFKFYRWRVEAEAQKKPGDKVLFVPSTTVASVGSTLTMSGSLWRVIAIQTESDALTLHVRLA